MIKYVENVKNVKEFNKLTKQVGWGTREESVVKKALKNTLFSISVYDSDEIIGYGRIIGDETIFLYIQDVMVSPKYQGQQIGKSIMKKLLIKVHEYQQVNPNIRTYLGADLNKEDFYRKFGFKTREEENLGPGMILLKKS